MKYGSVCSGIEAATLAWHPLGWEPVFFSEIEPFPCSVLTHHYPHVPNYGDMTKFKEWPDAAIDVLVGGTPCQSFSVAGLRKGLDDPRGNLMLTYLAIADRYRPRWLVWENVPGVLSSNGGRDFGTFLGGLGELGYGFAYRVLDAQYFGVPQRRRRVFVVGYLGDWRRAAAVLFERHSLSWNTPPRREKGEGAPRGIIGGIDYEGNGHGAGEPTGPLLKGSPSGGGHPLPAVVASTGHISHCLNAGGMGRQDYETETLVTHSLRGEGLDTSEDGTGRGTPLVPVAFAENSRAEVRLEGGDGSRCGTLSAGGGKAGQGVPCVAFNQPQMGGATPANGVSGILTKEGMSGTQGGHGAECLISSHMQVRRLTPRECERLQGFPDDYTAVPHRGKSAADGPRYKALGNSMAVPVMRWIGERVNMVDESDNP